MKMRTRIYEKAVPHRRRKRLACWALAAALFLIATAAAEAAPRTADAPRIAKEEAKALLGAPKVVFLDARVPSAWNSSDRKIPGAERADQFDFDTWADNYGRDTTFIVY